MKNWNKYIKVLLVLFIFLASCTDLEDISEDTISANGPAETGTIDPAAALQGAYNQLNNLGVHDNWNSLMEASTDEIIVPTRGTDWSDFGVYRQLHQHTWNTSHSFFFNTWDQLNVGAFRATQVIEITDDPAFEGPARFLRAFYTYNLVDLFGQVPIRTNLNDPDEVPTVLNRTEATQMVLEDLQYAETNLPSISSFVTRTAGKASKEAAQFLLAKVYLNKAVFTAANPAGPYTFSPDDMQKVISNCDAIINSNNYSLSDYWDNFSWTNGEDSKELIFTVENLAGSPVANIQNRYYSTVHYNQQPSGWNGFSTTSTFFEKWNKTTTGDDIRKGAAIPGLTDVLGVRAGFLEGQQYDKDGNPLTDRAGNPLIFIPEIDLLYSGETNGIRVIKYLPDPSNLSNPGNDLVFFRYADVILMKAEALLRSGDAASALTLVNELRTFRGALPLAVLDETSLLDERGYELYWEGWRRNDMVRFGVFLGEWQEKKASDPKSVLYPIPQRAMDTNKNFEQNPGY